MDQFFFGINEIKNSISVLLIRGCECDDLVVLIQLLQAIVKMRSNVDSSIRIITFIIQWDSDDHIRLLFFWVSLIQTMDQSLINIKY